MLRFGTPALLAVVATSSAPNALAQSELAQPQRRPVLLGVQAAAGGGLLSGPAEFVLAQSAGAFGRLGLGHDISLQTALLWSRRGGAWPNPKSLGNDAVKRDYLELQVQARYGARVSGFVGIAPALLLRDRGPPAPFDRTAHPLDVMLLAGGGMDYRVSLRGWLTFDYVMALSALPADDATKPARHFTVLATVGYAFRPSRLITEPPAAAPTP